MVTPGGKTRHLVTAGCLAWLVTLTSACSPVCSFSPLARDQVPALEAQVQVWGQSSLPQCATSCLQVLGQSCSALAFHAASGLCRLYSDLRSRGRFLSSPDVLVFTACQGWPGDHCRQVDDCRFSSSECSDGLCHCPAPCSTTSSSALDSCAPTACVQLLKAGQTRSGVYTLDLQDGGPTFQAYCDMTTDGGGWTVFQRREDGSVSFNRTWIEYKDGFGKLTGNHWLGNDLLARLTAARKTELRVELRDLNNATAFAQYSTFLVGPASSNFALSIGGYCGTSGDGFGVNGSRFSTWDADNDNWSDSCTRIVGGGFWYWACSKNSIHGAFPGSSQGLAMRWGPWSSTGLRFTELKLR